MYDSINLDGELCKVNTDRFNHKGGQSRDTHVVISHDLFTFLARLKVGLTIMFLVFGGFQK